MTIPVLKMITARRDVVGNLVCFPYAGGGPSVFRAWPSRVPSAVGVLAAHLGGREGRFDATPHTDLEEQVGELVEAIRPLTGKPIVLYGHSLGATLAAHVAQELFPLMSAPSALVVAARRPPWSHTEPGLDGGTRLSDVPDAQVLEFFRRIGGIDQALLDQPELVDVVMPSLRADTALAEDGQFLRCQAVASPVFALCGSTDGLADATRMDPWRQFTSGVFKLVTVQGGHLFLNTNRSHVLDFIASTVAMTLRRAVA